MITITQTEFRQHMKKYMDAVEGGETIRVFRHGKPLATVAPDRGTRKSYWQSVEPLHLDGVTASDIIIQEREEGW
jgi:prevent-host-death family protein